MHVGPSRVYRVIFANNYARTTMNSPCLAFLDTFEALLPHLSPPVAFVAIRSNCTTHLVLQPQMGVGEHKLKGMVTQKLSVGMLATA